MSYIDRNLLPDEQVLFRTKKHYIIFLPSAVLSVLVLYMYIGNNPFFLTVAWIPTLAAFFLWGVQWLEYATSEFAVTNKRVMLKEGFFYRHANELRLTTISQIEILQSLPGQWLDYGSVGINAFGGSTDMFTYIAAPNQFKKYVEIELDKLVR